MADNNVPDEVSPAPKVPAQAPEAVRIFEGSVSLWMGVKTFVVSGLLDIAGIAMAIYGAMNSVSALLIAGVALLMASSLMAGYAILSIRTQRYKITSRLIEREQGLLFKRVDALDLTRVKDVQLSQSLVDRMLNIGTIEVFSSDKTDPVMFIEAIPTPRPVYEKLRDAVIEISQRRGIVPMS
ncbi:MAG TPA: PH domain-containing protein [Planctomycetota bacterium]|nr:PH domain-containing protein [Planctomycetota bacterium]